MADLWVFVTVVAFFALCVALVWGCDRVIGPDDPTDLVTDEPTSSSEPVEAAR
jgi:hypothetical protein